MLVGGLVNEPVGPVLGTTRSHVAWKIFPILVAILGLAVLGRSAGSWAAAEAGSKSVVRITPEALQKKDEEECYATSELVDKCSGWGDPHFEPRFHNMARTDNLQIGVMPLAKSTDGNFELQGFQCLAGWSASTFAAFAVKINGKTATYFGADNANLEWHGTGPPSGLTMTGTPSDSQGFAIHSPNLCQSLWIKKKSWLGLSRLLFGFWSQHGFCRSMGHMWPARCFTSVAFPTPFHASRDESHLRNVPYQNWLRGLPA